MEEPYLIQSVHYAKRQWIIKSFDEIIDLHVGKLKVIEVGHEYLSMKPKELDK